MLKRCLDAGLSCGQTAPEIGVTRNTVIGKINRLGLSRPKEVVRGQQEERRAATLARPKHLNQLSQKRSRLNISPEHEMAVSPISKPLVEAIPIHDGRGCTLLELSQTRCRWPINHPGLKEFCFGGNESVRGLPYCLGHARIAYPSVARVRRHRNSQRA
jgi:GcrA cell cycle regulator